MARRLRLEKINGVLYWKGVRFHPRHLTNGRRAPYNPNPFVPQPQPPIANPNPPIVTVLIWQEAVEVWSFYTGTFEDYD